MSTSTRTLAIAAGSLCAVAMLPSAPGTAQPVSPRRRPRHHSSWCSTAGSTSRAPALSHTGPLRRLPRHRRGQTPRRPATPAYRSDGRRDGSSTPRSTAASRSATTAGRRSSPPTARGWRTRPTRPGWSRTTPTTPSTRSCGTCPRTPRCSPAWRSTATWPTATRPCLAVEERPVRRLHQRRDRPGPGLDHHQHRRLPAGPDHRHDRPGVGPPGRLAIRGTRLQLSTDISSNGNIVAFTSYDTDLGQNEGNDGEADLFVRNMTTEHTRWLSRGFPAGANPDGVVISPNGRWVSTRWDDGSLHLTRAGTGVRRP